MVGGAKLCTCEPSLPLRVQCSPLQLSPDALATIESHLQLIYTGKTRLARNLLRDVVRRWLLGRPPSVRNVRRLDETAANMALALGAGDVAEVGRLLSAYWEQKKRMCEAEPPSVARMLTTLRKQKLIHGGALAGAGGGGFLLVVTREPRARAALERALDDEGVTCHRVTIDDVGLRLSFGDDGDGDGDGAAAYVNGTGGGGGLAVQPGPPEAEARPFVLEVPEGAIEGDRLYVSLPTGKRVEVVVPPGAAPGDRLTCG